MLGLFENIEVKKVDRLNEADLHALRSIQEKFDNDKIIFDKLISHVNTFENLPTNEYLSFATLQSDLRGKLKESAAGFISKIYSHFRYKYQVELENKLWDDGKFRWDCYTNSITWDKSLEYVNSMNYEVILDDIYSQLGTLNFANKGKQEFLDKVKDQIGYRMVHKNNKISYNSLVYRDSDQDEITYSSTKSLEMMLQSLNLFENDSYSLSYWASNFSEKCRSNWNTIFTAFATHTSIPYCEIEQIKIFKNGKVELKFEDYNQAEKYYNMFYKENGYRK